MAYVMLYAALACLPGLEHTLRKLAFSRNDFTPQQRREPGRPQERKTLIPDTKANMSASNRTVSSSVIFQGTDQAAPRPLAPPEYRQQALRHVIDVNRSSGTDSMSLSELAHQMWDQALRSDTDPSLEPMSLKSIDAAVSDLVRTREISVVDRTVVFSAPA